MKSNKSILKLFCFSFCCCFSNFNSFSQNKLKLAVDTITTSNDNIILYDDKSWEYLPVVKRKNYLKAFADTSSIFTKNWKNSTFAYKDKFPPDSVLITYLDDQDKYVIPVIDRINSGFKLRNGTFHKGLDIHLTRTTPVKAAFNGKVRYARFNTGGYGNLVIIRHFNGLETYYAHLSRLDVKEDQLVQAGKVIGLGGNTGVKWSGPHLHFEVRYHDFAFDPEKIFSIKDSVLLGDKILLKKADFHSVIAASRKYHRIKSGETLSYLAVRYNTTVSKILKINPKLNINSIIGIGMKIRVR
ncbi:MAG: peptidoglycan DD-metalloendopeptidase family protein [Formosa sp.]|jgi:murein DD-endopeptidase MepM/ murein hydrolase activator NlpD|nr:peptidoglycan DD-metalloendopeptidase family protein [Formosa sp.]MDC0463591.1 M23 family metallopeptidase [Flavobacteriaceae bacterium]